MAHPRSRQRPDAFLLDTEHRILIRRRVTIIAAVMLVALAGLLVRLVQLQVVRGARLQHLAARQQLLAIELPPHRGRLLDRAGRPLAINVEAASLYAVPAAIADPLAFADRIAPVLGVPQDEILRRLRAGRYFAWLARKVSPDIVARVRALGLGDQIGFRTEDRRAYPNGVLAAHLLGFVGIDNQGLDGIELAYDQVLRGTAGRAVAAHDGLGRVLVETQRTVQMPQDGNDLLLTIDQVIQHIAERELDAAMARTRARRGTATVMDARTGEIYALAVRPVYDPNRGTEADPALWLNRTLAEVYEPGSTFKIFLAAAALDSGSVSAEQKFRCGPSLRVAGGHVIRNAHNLDRGWLAMPEVIEVSCNTAAAQIATAVGKATFHRYIRAFGFGQRLGVDLPGEVAGLVPPPEAWLGPGLQTIAFGQGVSVTPLQLLAAGTAFANDGVMVRPHVVRGLRDAQDRTTAVAIDPPTRRAIRPETARAVFQMMIGVVERGTGTLARLDGYEVAGKTGTAQKPVPGGYAPGRFVASFLGIVPADDPKLIILVALDEPVGLYYGGEVAAPVFREIASQTLWYLRIPPREQFTHRPDRGNGTEDRKSHATGD